MLLALALVGLPAADLIRIDLSADTRRQVVVDREKGQYLGHVSTVLLEDGRTILATYPKGHGKGPIILKRSADGGKTWGERLPVPENWSSSLETPTIHRVEDPKTGKKRLIVWSGLYPARLASSEDDGKTWTPLAKAGDWGGIVVMGFVERLADGRYLAMFHDDGRFFKEGGGVSPTFSLYKTFSADGGLTWSTPETVWSGSEVHLCEPGVVRSPDGKRMAVLLRENRRAKRSHVIYSGDEGATWSAPREVDDALTGDRHTAKYAPDGRLVVSFRDMAKDSPTHGDWVAWVGTFEDIEKGAPGQYRVRLMDNKKGADCAYPGVEVLPDGTFVCTTYGHWTEGEEPYIVSVRFTLAELDALAHPAKGKLGSLADRVVALGEDAAPEKEVDSFLKLGGKSARRHWEFDSERQVLAVRDVKGSVESLVFLVPEKPFPEFGKTWGYQVSLEGKLLAAGVAEPRAAFKKLADAKAADAGAQAEISFWTKQLLGS